MGVWGFISLKKVSQLSMKVVAIIQARMASTRLPGKVLANVCGKPMLYYVVSRVQQAHTLDLVVIATSDHSEDDVIERFCETIHVDCFRGSLDDVLDRYYRAAERFEADAIVRLTADCPLLDPMVIDKVVRTFLDGRFDYVANGMPPTYPDGLDTEVFARGALVRAWREAKLPSEREHVTPFLYNNPTMFRLGRVRFARDLSKMRWTVDEPQDLDLIRRIFDYLHLNPDFGMNDVLALFREHPELNNINAGLTRNEGYEKSLQEDKSKMKGQQR